MRARVATGGRMRTVDAVRRAAAAAFAVALLAMAAGCGDERPGGEGPAAPPAGDRAAVEDPGPVHVHGLGINPKDGALVIATHSGLFRSPPGSTRAERIGDSFQDTMGFTVVGPDHFLGSGHPDLSDDLPPYLGLIESRDGGRSWTPRSLLGRVDFHVLEARGDRVYGFGSDFETRTARFLVSDDGGRNWSRREAPESLIALAIDPRDARAIVVSGERGLHRSDDAGRSWRPLTGKPGLLAWTEDRLFAVGLDGRLRVSTSAGRDWRETGGVGESPAALEAAGDTLLVALHDGTVKQSRDGGRSWTIRSRP